MDFLSLGLDAALIAGIIGITECVKAAIPVTWQRYIILAPAIFGLGAAAAVVQPWTLSAWIVKGISYAGVSAYLYKSGKTVWGK